MERYTNLMLQNVDIIRCVKKYVLVLGLECNVEIMVVPAGG